MSDNFDQSAYWLARHEKYAGDPRSVGNLGKMVDENTEGDRIVVRWVRQAAALLPNYRDVLDIGCGYGRVAPCFCEHGFNYHGVDVSPVAIDRAKESMRSTPAAQFEAADLMTWRPQRDYDLVCALFVLVHFVDDEAWQKMLERMLGWIRPGGGFLLAESEFPAEGDTRRAHVRPRPLANYEPILDAAGFQWRPGFAEQIAAKLPQDAKQPPCHLAVRA